MSVPDLLQALRAHEPAAPALSLLTGLREDFRWSYQQLAQATLGFRLALQAGGARPGTSVCLIAQNCPQFIALFLACIELGTTFIPLQPDHSAATVTRILRELRPVIVIVEEEIQGRLLRTVLREACTAWRLRLRRAPWLRRVLSAGARKGKAPAGVYPAQPLATDAAPVLVLHSSGSTGAPKVIEYNRERLNVFLHWQRRLFAAFPDAPGTRAPSPRVNALPMAHFGGLSFVLQGLLDGRLVHLPRTMAPLDYLRLALREQCQLLMLVPALYEAVLRDTTMPVPPSALRYCLTMGEEVAPQLIERVSRALGARVYSAYGMSEGLSGLAHYGTDTPPNSCGRLLFGAVKLVDDAGHADGTDCDEGELWVRNATTFRCYRDPALNAAKFVDDWYRTGDRFRRDARGHHYFLGRVDALCVINGRNVYPAEIERVFLRHPAIADCMAATVTLQHGRKRLAVLVCLRADNAVTPAGLIDWFLERGPLHATPAWLLLGKGIPLNAAGKRDRVAVGDLLQQDYRECARKVS